VEQERADRGDARSVLALSCSTANERISKGLAL
jgi:hypothetical protein